MVLEVALFVTDITFVSVMFLHKQSVKCQK